MKRLDTLLLLAHEPITAKLIKKLVGNDLSREIISIDNPGSAIGAINNNAIEAVIMDAAFPGAVDQTGVETFRSILREIPIITLVHTDDEDLGVRSIDQGADDFLLLDHLTSLNIARAVTSAIHRRGVDKELVRSQASADRFNEIIQLLMISC